MYRGCRIGGILLMGGEGRRFGSAMPKQFHFLGGKRVYRYALDVFLESGLFDEIVLVCHGDWMGWVEEESGVRVVEGGGTRQGSSYAGIRGFVEKPEIILIHDGVRPFVSKEILRANVDGAIDHGAVDTCISSADTLVYAPGGERIAQIPKREEFLRGQTPQTFRREWVVEAHERALRDGIENASDDCRLVLNAGREIRVVAGSEENLKITSELDLFMAEKWLQHRNWIFNGSGSYAEGIPGGNLP